VRDVELQTADARVSTLWLQFPAKLKKFCKVKFVVRNPPRMSSP